MPAIALVHPGLIDPVSRCHIRQVPLCMTSRYPNSQANQDHSPENQITASISKLVIWTDTTPGRKSRRKGIASPTKQSEDTTLKCHRLHNMEVDSFPPLRRPIWKRSKLYFGKEGITGFQASVHRYYLLTPWNTAKIFRSLDLTQKSARQAWKHYIYNRSFYANGIATERIQP